MQRTLLATLALAGALGIGAAEAQSLGGSRASVDRMYRHARDADLTFYRTSVGARSAVEDGDLVRFSGNADYRLDGASHPYGLATTRTFVQRLGAQYRAACGERLVITSVLRPTSFRLANGSARSVHPAGMAVDIRKSRNPRCLRWLRETLLSLEKQGVIEATEENRPPHFHVAIYPAPYRRYVSARGGEVPNARTASSSSSSATRSAGRESRSTSASSGGTRYRVRRGDSLWSIARRHGTSVERLRDANNIRGSRVEAGQTIIIPAR